MELLGEPGTGKTALLMECLLRGILPARIDGVDAGGRGLNSPFIDCDGGFHTHEFSRLLRARVRAVLSRAVGANGAPGAPSWKFGSRVQLRTAETPCARSAGRLRAAASEPT